MAPDDTYEAKYYYLQHLNTIMQQHVRPDCTVNTVD